MMVFNKMSKPLSCNDEICRPLNFQRYVQCFILHNINISKEIKSIVKQAQESGLSSTPDWVCKESVIPQLIDGADFMPVCNTVKVQSVCDLDHERNRDQ